MGWWLGAQRHDAARARVIDVIDGDTIVVAFAANRDGRRGAVERHGCTRRSRPAHAERRFGMTHKRRIPCCSVRRGAGLKANWRRSVRRDYTRARQAVHVWLARRRRVRVRSTPRKNFAVGAASAGHAAQFYAIGVSVGGHERASCSGSGLRDSCHTSRGTQRREVERVARRASEHRVRMGRGSRTLTAAGVRPLSLTAHAPVVRGPK